MQVIKGGPSLRAIQICAVIALILLGLYHASRVAAARCNGTGCDWYIAPSVILPLSVLAMVAVSGILAIFAAIRRLEEPNGREWLIAIIVATVLGVAGPVVLLPFLRDSPDALVITGTILYLLAPVSALAYTLTRT